MDNNHFNVQGLWRQIAVGRFMCQMGGIAAYRSSARMAITSIHWEQVVAQVITNLMVQREWRLTMIGNIYVADSGNQRAS